ncbi:hypothetical protein LT85_3228 [Collimonas arenae]|uniref:Uncharacterized protein n=1 Tax=Collimonas arenae TaxID=279058 RepID=A0A0A1FD03_9BURK|nr:hypothetical protein [Collimonas arenae]AIY42386.1 hypothetical protein LT85_3228 [Collimonas arenae]
MLPSLKLCLSGALLFSCASFGATVPLRFDGMPFEPQTLQVKHLDVNAAGALVIDMGQQGVASISPWPDDLPRHLGKQQVEIDRTLHPAGAIETLDLSRPRSTAPWLMITANGPLQRELVPGYRLQRDSNGVMYIQGPATQLAAEPGKPVYFRDQARRCWQFVLLDARIPPATPGTALEAEPRADWYLRGDLSCRKP